MANFNKRSGKTGLAPGSLIHIGAKKSEKVEITVIDYNSEVYNEKELKTIEEVYPYRDSPTASWININGLHETNILEKIGNHFGVHPLVLEDILNTNQRPKIDEFEDYIFVVLKMLTYNEQKQKIESEQISIIIGYNFVISFQEQSGDVFEPLRKRLTNEKSRIRKCGADYLAYAILDAIVDNYFIILEHLEERVDLLEDSLLKNPSQNTLHEINRIKREVIFLTRSIWPLREVIGTLSKGDSTLIDKNTLLYIRDVYDHIVQLIDTLENFKDLISQMLDIYLSSINNKMNEIIKVLTIIATVFMPLTFIVGLYGMNFNTETSPWNMPELNWYWGYPFTLLTMAFIAIIMLFFFKKKKWI